jgi:hypothetical protein
MGKYCHNNHHGSASGNGYPGYCAVVRLDKEGDNINVGVGSRDITVAFGN